MRFFVLAVCSLFLCVVFIDACPAENGISLGYGFGAWNGWGIGHVDRPMRSRECPPRLFATGAKGTKMRRDGCTRTRDRLIAAAGDVFARKNYSAATVAEICEQARTNIAAVNYHFGDKETLYRETWRRSFLASVRAHPMDGGVDSEAPPERRLQGMIMSAVARIADASNKACAAITLGEVAAPSKLLAEVIEMEVAPLHRRMQAIVSELLGPHCSRAQVQFCVVSIMNQCANPLLARSSRRSDGSDEEPFPGRVDDIAAYAAHVVEFSLGGIRAVSGRRVLNVREASTT